MNLAFATLKYYPFGGLEKSFLNICKEALRRGHELTIYCRKWQGDRLAGANIIELPVKGLTNHAKLQEFHRLLMQSIEHLDPDLLVGFKRMPDLDLYYNGDVCFIEEAQAKHGSWYRLTPRYRTLAAFERAVFDPAGQCHVMYISEREKQIYQRIYKTPEQRFHSLPAGIDKRSIRTAIENQKRKQLRVEHQLTDQQVVCLMVGSDFKRKGVDRSIAAVAALPPDLRKDVVLWVIGAGDSAPYQKQASQAGIASQVVFLGGRSDVPDWLAAADILLHPARQETAGNAILEGLVAGLPVVVSACAGFSVHVAEAEAGILVEDKNYQSGLNHALETLVSNPELRERYGQKGWDYADSTDLYNRPQVALDIIEELAGVR